MSERMIMELGKFDHKPYRVYVRDYGWAWDYKRSFRTESSAVAYAEKIAEKIHEVRIIKIEEDEQ